MFSNVLHRKETFFSDEKIHSFKDQISNFSKGVNACFWSKNVIFSLFLFGQNKTGNKIQ